MAPETETSVRIFSDRDPICWRYARGEKLLCAQVHDFVVLSDTGLTVRHIPTAFRRCDCGSDGRGNILPYSSARMGESRLRKDKSDRDNILERIKDFTRALLRRHGDAEAQRYSEARARLYRIQSDPRAQNQSAYGLGHDVRGDESQSTRQVERPVSKGFTRDKSARGFDGVLQARVC